MKFAKTKICRNRACTPLRDTRGMTLVELMVSMLLLIVFMGVVTTVVSGLGNVVSANVALNRRISIADSVLNQIEADTRMASYIKCGADTTGTSITYGSEAQGFTILLSAPTQDELGAQGETLYIGKNADGSSALESRTRMPGYLERRYYLYTSAPGWSYPALTTDGKPYARGLNQPFVPDFYLGSTVGMEFVLEQPKTTLDAEGNTVTTYGVLLATVTVYDDGAAAYQASRSILLLNHPVYMGA